MRGTADWGVAYPIAVDRQHVQLARALGFDPEARLRTSIVRAGTTLRIQFAEGVLDASIEP